MGQTQEMSTARRGPTYVVDTSVALKWFLEAGEADVREARQLRDAHLSGQCTLRAPDFLLIEIANALTMGRRVRVEKVLEALDAVRRIELSLNTISFGTLSRAVEIASSYRVTVYDSYFLALAVELDCSLVTADEAFMRKAGVHPNVLPLRQLRSADG